MARVVLEEVARLPEQYRAAVVMCDLEGLAHEEVACRLGCPIGTVKIRQARGGGRLRGSLARRGLPPSAMLAALRTGSATGVASPPAWFREATARLASAGTAGDAAAATVPADVEALASGGLESM